jgi:hypothetical protein
MSKALGALSALGTGLLVRHTMKKAATGLAKKAKKKTVEAAKKVKKKAVAAAKPKVTKQVEKAKKVNETVHTGKGTSSGGSSKPGTGARPKLKGKTPAAKKTQARNQSKKVVKKAKASQAGKEAHRLKGKTKNSTDRLKGRKA